MDYNVNSVIQNELDSDEKLLWAGMPKQGILFRRSDIFMIPFSLFWGGFAIFWEIMVLDMQGDKSGATNIIFPLFGIPFVIIGLYIIFGRFIYDSKKRAKTFYGLTDKRVIIISGLFNKNVKSLNLKTMGDVSLYESRGGYGTISFGQENQMMSMFVGANLMNMGNSSVPKFELIKNAKQVYGQLRNQQKS